MDKTGNMASNQNLQIINYWAGCALIEEGLMYINSIYVKLI